MLTVFAGVPRNACVSTPWDRRSGFANAGEAVRERRAEDRRALASLHARPVWLDMADAQYGESPGEHELALALRSALVAHQAAPILFPLGLYHPDHLLLHQACLAVLGDLQERETFAYEDCVYRAMPGLLQQRLLALADAGMEATPATLEMRMAVGRKRRALAAYGSQLRAFGREGWQDATRPERLWRLSKLAGPPVRIRL